MRIRTTTDEDGGGGSAAPPTEYHSLASRAMEFDGGGSSQHCGLRRGGQSVAMVQAPSRKTGDEVWGDIQQGGKKKKKMTMAMVMNHPLQSLDEMTLEDFLVKAGEAAACSGGNRVDQMGSFGFRPYIHWLHHHPQQQQQHQPPIMTAGTGAILDSMYNDNQGNASSPTAVSPGRKRAVATDVVSEKTAERRKKRMIKNRESAARSRARKQAYTNELENKISLLEAENEGLRKQKELESVVHVPQPEPKYHLRRTRSAPF